MGSPLSYEYRRQELEQLHFDSRDAHVTDSYEQLVTPCGMLTRYLEMAKICVVLGDVAFAHGAFHEYNMGWVLLLIAWSIFQIISVVCGRVLQVGSKSCRFIRQHSLSD